MPTNLFGEDVPEPEVKEKKAPKPKRSMLELPTTKGPAPLPPPLKSRPKVPVKDRPGTRLSRRSFPLRALRGGEMRFIGTIDPEKRVYQRGIDMRHHVLGITEEMVFGYVDEWRKIERNVGTIEHIDLDHIEPDGFRVYVIKTSDARRLGRLIDTPTGQRWAVPLKAFDVVCKDGTVERKGEV